MRPADRLQAFADAFARRLAALDTVAAVQSRVDVQQILDGVLGRYLYNYLTEKDYAELEKRLTPAGIDAQVVADRAMLSAPFDLSAAKAVVEDPLGVRRLAASSLAESYREMAPSLSGGYFGCPRRECVAAAGAAEGICLRQRVQRAADASGARGGSGGAP